MKTMLPAGYQIKKTNELPHHILWQAIDELAYQGDIAVSCPDTAVLHACVEDTTGNIVGAVWSDSITGFFDFHLAVATEHRDCGLGRWLLDFALQAFENQRQTDPELQLKVYVVERRVWHALLKRGLRVLADHRALHRGYFAVEMGFPGSTLVTY